MPAAQATFVSGPEQRPRLRHARIRDHQVGLRPGRPSVRLDIEQVGESRCVHSYGHGGSGVTLSWGCARQTVAMLTDQQGLSIA